MVCEHFRSCDGAQGLSDLFSILLQNDDVQDFDVRWDQASRTSPNCKESPQLHSDYIDIVRPRNDSKWRTTELSRLMTSVIIHIDQTMRNKKLQYPERSGGERGAVTKSCKGKKPFVERKVGECFQWKANGSVCQSRLDNVLKETHVVTDVRIIGQKGQSSSPAPNAKLQNDGKIPSKSSSSRGASPAKRGRFRADIGESVRTRHVVIGTLPCVIITSLKQDAMSGMSRRRRKRSKKSKKGGAKGSGALWKESVQLCCVSKNSYPRRSTLWEEEKIGINTREMGPQSSMELGETCL